MVSNKAQKAIAAAMTGAMVFGMAAPALAATTLNNGWVRIDGKHNETYNMLGTAGGVVTGTRNVDGVDRYDTMFDAIAVNAEATPSYWTPGLSDVVLVSGESFADTLSSSSLAGYFGSPVITTKSDSLGVQADRAIRYFAGQSTAVDSDGNPTLNVYIIGGTAAVSEKVARAVDNIDKAQDDATKVSVNVIRIWGNTRQETSTRVMEYVDELLWMSATGTYPNMIFVANGDKWMDALSTSSYSYNRAAPLVLTNSDGSLDADQLDYLKDALENGVSVQVIGGPAKLAYDTLSALQKKAGSLRYIAGDDRYDTSALIVDALGPAGTGSTIGVATGENWPDALIGGSFIGAQGGTLVLAGEYGKSGKNWNKAVKEAAEQVGNWGPFGNKYIIGGKSTISEGTANTLTVIL